MPIYSVITDTHGSPWGSKTADFDLGDNTPSTNVGLKEPIYATTATYIQLYGNHDVGVTGQQKGYQTSASNADKIQFIGLDTASGQNSYSIPSSQIRSMVNTLKGLPNDWNVMLFTHIPLFPRDPSYGKCYTTEEEKKWPDSMKSAETVLTILSDYNHRNKGSYNSISYDFSNRTGYVIGCFAGHVHNNIKRYYYGLYMETFMTNGSNSFTTDNENNAALYIPPAQMINVDLANHTVNGMPYIVEENYNELVSVGDTPMGKSYGAAAAGDRKFYRGSNNYPKFRQSRYVGYSPDQDGGAQTGNNNDGWWPLDVVGNVYLHGVNATARYIRFDANGDLRYYGNTYDENMHEILNYLNIKVCFDSEDTEKHWTTWKFLNGRYNGKKDTPVYSYRSGSLSGLNGYAIIFDANGIPDHMTYNGSTVSYGVNDNWMNVKEARIYWCGFGFMDLNADDDCIDQITNVPQIGLYQQSFASASRISLVRSRTDGDNLVLNKTNFLLRVVGGNNAVYWLYDGKLTDLTDGKLGL